MNRLLPKSLFGQTLLILLAGLIVSHAIGSWIYTADREQAVRAVGGFAAAQRIANLTRLVQEAPRVCGFAAEVAAVLSEKAIFDLRGPVIRVTGYDVPYPYWQIEDAYMPSVERVVDAARRVLAA